MTIASTRRDAGFPHVERLLADPAARPGGAALIGALAVDLDGAVLVLGPDGAVLARAGSAAAADIAHRAVTSDGGVERDPGAAHRDWFVRVWPLAAGGARSLVAARRRPWTSTVQATVGRAATIIATALLADENEAERDRLVGGRREVWRSVLQLLMTGQVAEAQRVASALEPAILDADRVRVHLLAGRPRDRDSLLGACEARLAALAVCVSCPARPGHVIIIEPVRETQPVRREQGDIEPGTYGLAPVPATLGGLTACSVSRSLGSSRSHPIAATAAAYAQAVGALAAAAVRPDRVADAEESTGLSDLIPAAAGGWASAVLAPLAADDGDGTLRHTLAVALAFTRAEAAAILGVHRNTVHARLTAAAHLLRVDLTRLPQRAAIDLALRVQPGAGEGDLPEVLGDPQLKIWADDLLDRLDGAVVPRGPARMRDLLRAFTHADGRITAAAHTVGLSPNSASRWLVAAEAAGGMRLRHGYGGAHEVAVALAAAEGLTLLPGR
jgi:hypothetical protein